MILKIVLLNDAVNFRIISLLSGLTLVLTLLSGCKSTPINPPNDENPASNIVSNESSAFSSNKLIRLTNGEWNPYTGSDLPGYGCDSRVVSEVFTEMGYNVEFGFFPWARAYHLAQIGEFDGTLEWDDTPNHREAFYISSEPLSNQKWVFYFRSDKPFRWDSLEDLRGKIVGITSNYAYSDAFTGLIKSGNVTFEEASSDEANFKKLLSGRIDVFPIEKSVGETILQKSFSMEEQSQLAFHPKPFHDFHPYLLLSREIPINAERMEKFNTGLINLKRSQKYNDIMKDCQN